MKFARLSSVHVSNRLTYTTAGVDVSKGSELVRRIGKLNSFVGGFSGRFPLGNDYLIGCADGVGTKLKVAVEMNKHDTVGIDLVAMNANDLITCGAKPLFFLDYYATGKLDVDVAETVIKGMMYGCEQAGCVLLGGETAELPTMLDENEYDLGGFMVGIVPKDKFIDGSNITKGDVLVGLPSSGLHSNGFALARKLLQVNKISLDDKTPWEPSLSFGEEFLKPTNIYVRDIQLLQDNDIRIKGMAHITGGGLIENIPRVFNNSEIGAYVDSNAWKAPPIFSWMKQKGNFTYREMSQVYNMGIGMVLVVSDHVATEIIEILPHARLIGEVWNRKGVIVIQ